jgi:hypothetical protein
MRKSDHFPVHGIIESVYRADAVSDCYDGSDIGGIDLVLVAFDGSLDELGNTVNAVCHSVLLTERALFDELLLDGIDLRIQGSIDQVVFDEDLYASQKFLPDMDGEFYLIA